MRTDTLVMGRRGPPWSTFNDPEVILRHAEEAGIDKTIIFPIENPTYQKANEEIARIVERYPGKFVGFAKHTPERRRGRSSGSCP